MGFGFFAHIENGDDSGMRQSSRRLRFMDEPLTVIPFFLRILPHQRNSFDRDQTVNLRVAGTIDNAHAAASYLGDDLIASDVRAYDCLHLGSDELRAILCQQVGFEAMDAAIPYDAGNGYRIALVLGECRDSIISPRSRSSGRRLRSAIR